MVNLHYIPSICSLYFQKMGFETGQFPHAEQYYKEAISIPMFPKLTNAQQLEVVQALRDILC